MEPNLHSHFAKGEFNAQTMAGFLFAPFGGGTQTFTAREIVKGGKTLTLRDKGGTPEWKGMMHGEARP